MMRYEKCVEVTHNEKCSTIAGKRPGELFRNTADKMGLNDAIVEKDFWVCFTLDYLFHRCP